MEISKHPYIPSGDPKPRKRTEPDYCSHLGAELLKAHLEAYYSSRGEKWKFWLEPVHGRKKYGGPLWAVKSNVTR